jgi:predicted aspartyl protease
MNMTSLTRARASIPAVLAVLFTLTLPIQAARENWQRTDVDWQAGGGKRIKSIQYPKDKPVPTRAEPQASAKVGTKGGMKVTAVADEMLVESPPVDGFVPWIAVSITKERGGDLELDAVVETAVKGTYPTGVKPQMDYIIGLFDTGSSAHIVGFADATRAGVYKGLLTSNETDVTGVTGSVTAAVSYPLGVFISGLSAINPNTLVLDRSAMMGQSNVAVLVGEDPGDHNDLPTAIGPPLSVYYTSLISNDLTTTVQRNGETFTGPEITLYAADDPKAPSFTNVIPLELRPLGAVSVEYMPTVDLGGLGGLGGDWDLDNLDDLLGGGGTSSDYPPSSPSVIMGNSSQSLFFVHSVDLYEGQKCALDKNRFMLDTGAQVTVVGSRMAARLQLDLAAPEFQVEIEGVTGDTVMAPGYYIDAIEIPALGQWFRATHVPVIYLDVSSPEGGTLDGIIGMNLFVDFNLIVRGGGLFLEDDPALELQRIEPAAQQ